MQKMPRARGEELVLFRKRSNEKENDVTESKPENMSKKKSNMYGQNKKKEGGKESLKVIKEETEKKLSIKESKEKSGTHSNKVCYCAPTTHEGSFRCRLHRKKSATDGKSNTRMNSQCTKGIVEFQPHFSSVVRVPSVQVGTHGSLLKLLRMDSV